MVPLPNSSLAPGAVIQVTAPNGGPVTNASRFQIRWLGSLQDCRVPMEALAINSASVPGITSDKTFSLDASIGAQAAGVTLGSLGANLSGDANLTIASATDTSLNYLHFTSWLSDPTHRAAVAGSCGDKLSQTNVFVVQEAFVIAAGSYSFKSANGGKIIASPPHVPVNLSADTSIGDSGSVTITGPTVFALKALQQLPVGAFEMTAIRPRAALGHTRNAMAEIQMGPPQTRIPASSAIALGSKEIMSIDNLPLHKGR